MSKLTRTQIEALRLVAADPSLPRALRPSGHPVVNPTGRTWDKLKEMGLTEIGEVPGFVGRRTVLSQAGRELLDSLS